MHLLLAPQFQGLPHEPHFGCRQESQTRRVGGQRQLVHVEHLLVLLEEDAPDVADEAPPGPVVDLRALRAEGLYLLLYGDL